MVRLSGGGPARLQRWSDEVPALVRRSSVKKKPFRPFPFSKSFMLIYELKNVVNLCNYVPDMDRQGHEFQAPKGFGANVPYQDFYRHQQQQQQPQHLQMVLANLYREIQQTTDFKNHSIPLARIKKIMKADKDVRMIAAEAPIVLTRACEMFIFELTRRAWAHAEQNKRRTLQKNDIAAVLTKTNMYDFLAESMKDIGGPSSTTG
ncbi:nuclear transcription factor Y subunit C-2-like [Dendrobium catenatum]|uniref:nuclear transcription factor Y subunit C-2-like n=1 Tax=Dendrobium catenatum TaxID=906689 RepID=UPI00109FDCF7|nr:nuclear transcription factor Y subunit C-2-like [Dendrobium catenatum]